MRYTYYYKKYEHSKLATFISSLQGSFWGAIFFSLLPTMPLFVIGVNSDIPELLIASGAITLVLTISIYFINTDKLAQKRFKKKFEKKGKKLLIQHYVLAAQDVLNKEKRKTQKTFKSNLKKFKSQVSKIISNYISEHGASFIVEALKTSTIPPNVHNVIGPSILAYIIYYTLENNCILFNLCTQEEIISEFTKFIRSDSFNRIERIMDIKNSVIHNMLKKNKKI